METPDIRAVMPALFEPSVQRCERQVMRRDAHGWYAPHGCKARAGQGEAVAIHVTRLLSCGERLREQLQTVALPQRRSPPAWVSAATRWSTTGASCMPAWAWPTGRNCWPAGAQVRQRGEWVIRNPCSPRAEAPLHCAPMTALTIPALLLAAGRGERMRPLTDHTPKPLLQVQGRPLLAWHLHALAAAGVRQVVINTAWLGEQISSHFGFHPLLHGRNTLSISYSEEGRDFGHALETAGGIARALPLLGSDIFWLAAGDVFAPDFRFDAAAVQRFAASDALAHLWLVSNPPHHPRGDFGLSPEGRALNLPQNDPRERHTYSTIALLRAALFAPPWCNIPPGNPQGVAAPLAPLLRQAMDAGRVTAQRYDGRWTDVGTPERLAELCR